MFYNKRFILLDKCPNGEITKENWFIDLFSDMEIKIDTEYPYMFFLFKNYKCLFEQNYENDLFWVDYHKVWSDFEKKFNLEDFEIIYLIKRAVEKYFKMNISTDFNKSWLYLARVKLF